MIKSTTLPRNPLATPPEKSCPMVEKKRVFKNSPSINRKINLPEYIKKDLARQPETINKCESECGIENYEWD
jgi:hypothetical protein